MHGPRAWAVRRQNLSRRRSQHPRLVRLTACSSQTPHAAWRATCHQVSRGLRVTRGLRVLGVTVDRVVRWCCLGKASSLLGCLHWPSRVQGGGRLMGGCFVNTLHVESSGELATGGSGTGLVDGALASWARKNRRAFFTMHPCCHCGTACQRFPTPTRRVLP